ncbi:MAG: ferrous iron transport protein B [Oscillospiraceae bacterium]|nr:ferrous iron transport protein B [Oscillospiraceae bacterium]
MTLCLAGNQNCGKTTLFNELTGMNRHTGNWPGVTVERVSGTARGAPDIELIDLPGVYSLSPYTMEERVTRDYLLSPEAGGIINVVDATNLERNLYLTLQLCELRKPMIVALNMMDEVRASGDWLDVKALERELGLPVVPISARHGEGLDRLLAAARETVLRRRGPPAADICSGPLHEALHAICHLVETKAALSGLPVRYAATKLIEEDEPAACRLGLDETERHIIGEIKARMEDALGAEGDCALADARYHYISRLAREHIRRGPAHGGLTRSERIDRLLTHRAAAIPLFLAVMAAVFWLTFGPLGAALSHGFSGWLEGAAGWAEDALTAAGTHPRLVSLVTEGVLGGIFAMLGFLPVIVLLFLFLSLLEDSGYMARAAFIMDRLLRPFGLSGRAFIPMLTGFGCSVPAIMATRGMGNLRERRLTIFITPFMSCAARVPIYALLVAAFFGPYGAPVMTGVYAAGIAAALLCGLFLKDAPGFRTDATPLLLELPPYRLPALKSVARLLWDRAWDFIRRAFTVIFAASVVIWALSSFDARLRPVENKADSLLAAAGSFVAPAFAPLGFGDWETSTALIAGLMAKEAVVSTLAVLHETGEEGLPEVIRETFTPLSAWSFMVFVVLYMPCVAAFAVMKRELGKLTHALAAAAAQTGVAWLCVFLVYQVGRLVSG